MAELTSQQLAAIMHDDAVHLWNKLQAEVGEDRYWDSKERQLCEQVQTALKELAWPD